MLELRIDTDLQAALPAEIGFNFEELKAELAERLEHYRSLVVTADTIKEAKSDRAKLNKLRTAIDTRRKDIKSEYMHPYTVFEARIKELTALIDEPIRVIDEQLDGFETQRREEKRQQVQAIYNARIPAEVRELIPLDKIFDKRWLNATASLAKIDEEVEAMSVRIQSDLMALESIPDAYKTACREKYLATLDISESLAHMRSLQAADEAFRAREEAQTANTMADEKNAPEANSEPLTNASTQRERTYTLRLQFELTKAQANALRKFIDENNIVYKKI